MAGVLSNIMLTIGNLNNCVITMCCQRLVCDLQGGYYGDYYILTDPVIEVRGCSLAFTSASDGSMAEAGRAMRTLVAQGTLGKSMVS